MAVLRAGTAPVLEAVEASRVMVIGGELARPATHLVELRVELEGAHRAAKRDWVEGRIGKVAGDDEFIPLPND